MPARTIAMAMAQIRVAIIKILIIRMLPIVPIAAVAAARTQPHRADAIVHVAVAEIAMALGRVRLQPEHAAKAVVARENVHAVAAIRRHGAKAVVGDAQAIAFAVVHVDRVLVALEIGVGPECDASGSVDGRDGDERQQTQQHPPSCCSHCAGTDYVCMAIALAMRLHLYIFIVAMKYRVCAANGATRSRRKICIIECPIRS